VDPKSGRAVDWGSTLMAPNARVILQKQDDPLATPDFLLVGMETGQEIFRLGTSAADGAYYLWMSFGEHSGGMYGQTRLAGAPGAGSIPINPLDIATVLAITPLPSDFSQPPAVLMRLNDKPGQCAYVLTYIDRQPVTNKIVARRDIHFNWNADANLPIRPFRVDLLDDVGRAVMTASLRDYRPVRAPGEDAPAADAAVVPSDIEIVWPKTGSRIHVVLSPDSISTKRVDPDAFRFRDRLPAGVEKNLTCVDPQPTTSPVQR